MFDIDDLLGFQKKDVTIIDDLLDKPKRKRGRRKVKVNDLLGKKKRARKYEPLKVPRSPEPHGIFAAREAKGNALGRTCLVCKDELEPPRRGRPPVICRKKACFREYRNMYRKDYDKQRSVA